MPYIWQSGTQHISERVTENHSGQNMISLLNSQLLVRNAGQKGEKYAGRPSPCQSQTGYLPAPQETHRCYLSTLSCSLPPPTHTHTHTLSSLTPTFLWLYWSVLTTSVWLDGCSINTSLRPVRVPLKAGFRAAASSVAVWQAPAFGALIMVFTDSRPSNAKLSRFTGKAWVMSSRNDAARLNRDTSSMQQKSVSFLSSVFI